MRNKKLQMSLFDTYDEVLDLMEGNKPELIEIIDEYIDFEAIIPFQFHMHYHAHTGRKRINPEPQHLLISKTNCHKNVLKI